MIARVLLRLAAIAIAIAGAIDPAMTVARPAPQPLGITLLGAPSDAAYSAASRVQTAVSDLFDVAVQTQPAASDASPCPSDGACVVISDGTAPRRLATNGVLGGVRAPPDRTPTAAIAGVSGPRQVDPGARGVLDVTVESKEPSPSVRVFDGDVLVGQSTTGRVDWTPIAGGVRDLRVVTADDEAHVAVEVAPQRHDVLFYEPQPTWMGTFVRRALESDPRFAVRSRARVARGVTVGVEGMPLEVGALEQADPRVIVVTSVELLTAAEVTTLQQFVTRRGGSVIALLEHPPAGASRVLLPFLVTERREAQPVQIGELRASELLTFGSLDAVSTALAATGESPVVVTRFVGNGRIIASGASDAWRYRHDGSFDAFWQSLVADAAAAADDPLTITLDKTLVRPRERVRVDVDWRPLGEIARTIEARGAVVCGDRAFPIRLWPSGSPGRFEGEFVAAEPAECHVTATLNGVTGTTPLMVRDVRTTDRPADELSAAITAHGGTIVTAGDEAPLITALRQSAARRDISTQIHPMRSPLWIIPFAACLGGEWYVRRRHGGS